jgi:hypothetical protein
MKQAEDKHATNDSKDNSHHLWNIIFVGAGPLYIAYLIANAFDIINLIKLFFK